MSWGALELDSVSPVISLDSHISPASEPDLSMCKTCPETPVFGDIISLTFNPNLSSCKWVSEAFLKRSKPRGDDLTIMDPTFNHFAQLPVERTEDEENHENDLRQRAKQLASFLSC